MGNIIYGAKVFQRILSTLPHKGKGVSSDLDSIVIVRKGIEDK